MHHQPITEGVPILHDPFNIGQDAEARISAEVAREAMNRTALTAFNWRYEGGVLGMVREAAMASIHYHAAIERKALAVLRRAA